MNVHKDKLEAMAKVSERLHQANELLREAMNIARNAEIEFSWHTPTSSHSLTYHPDTNNWESSSDNC